MQSFIYAATIGEPYPNDFVLQFVDIPEAITGGATVEEALIEASDALAVAVDFFIREGRSVPDPRPLTEGEYGVALEPAIAARLLLSRAMAEQKLSKVALATRMKRDEKVVRRILSGKGASLDLILEALAAVGVRPALVA